MYVCGRCTAYNVQRVRFPPIQFGTCNIYSAVTATIIQPPKYVFVYAAISFYACVPLESVGATLSHLRHFQGAYKQYTRRAVCPYRQTHPRAREKTAMHAGLTVSPTCGVCKAPRQCPFLLTIVFF